MVFPTLHPVTFEQDNSKEGLRANLDLLEERRVEAHLRTLAYKKATTRLNNRRGKLTPNWEGPYRVYNVVREETYRLETMGGSPLPRSWNASNLRRFYL
ncbi:unnamed protein product [Musa acuminata subsp. malaccensis]|uniref:(wild Malaysian banana) hypothetical protein n=1 Tax=Musa acuminata subsp. malaccensis TaxID=214687 RepID=A0A804KL43_MUSAM|nr:unnamed protein product [Musa acuminata subsp. malaccensis]